jgi:hypothetical protein
LPRPLLRKSVHIALVSSVVLASSRNGSTTISLKRVPRPSPSKSMRPQPRPASAAVTAAVELLEICSRRGSSPASLIRHSTPAAKSIDR